MSTLFPSRSKRVLVNETTTVVVRGYGVWGGGWLHGGCRGRVPVATRENMNTNMNACLSVEALVFELCC